MVTVNPEQKQIGKYDPIHRVTAVFKTREALSPILEALHQAGFGEEKIDLFIGEEGAEQLDLTGKSVGAVVRFLNELKTALTDETEAADQIDESLRNGGMSINVLTGTDDEQKRSAVQILKTHNPQDLRYWGHLSSERF